MRATIELRHLPKTKGMLGVPLPCYNFGMTYSKDIILAVCIAVSLVATAQAIMWVWDLLGGPLSSSVRSDWRFVHQTKSIS
jgi:hypothetical protein